jgi:hypothetical protein
VVSAVSTVVHGRAKIEQAKDAGRPHTEMVWGRPRTQACDDLQPARRGRICGGDH